MPDLPRSLHAVPRDIDQHLAGASVEALRGFGKFRRGGEELSARSVPIVHAASIGGAVQGVHCERQGDLK